MTSRWRRIARETIRTALTAYKGDRGDADAVKKHLMAAYPFGERARHPYTIYRDEVRSTLADLAHLHGSTPLSRPCGACGAARGKPCRMITTPLPLQLEPGTYHAVRQQPPSGALFGES